MASGSTSATNEEYLMAVGKVVNNATLAEAFMFTAFKILSGCETIIASAIFYTHDSFSGKKSLLRRLVESVGDDEDKRLIGAIIDACIKSNNQRRELAHSIPGWAEPHTTSPAIIYQPKTRSTKPVTKDSLLALIRVSFEAVQEGQTAFQKLAEKHGKPLVVELG